MTVRVTTAVEAAAMDARAIGSGTPSYDLMDAAGRAAAAAIAERCAPMLGGGVVVFAGGGNNGGDGYVVAAELAKRGVAVRLVPCQEPRTDDARRARGSVPPAVPLDQADAVAPDASPPPGVVVDALLGTGASGAPRDAYARAIAVTNALRARGARVVALDVPSGVDATSGATPGVFVAADITVTFGTVKRGLLRRRGAAGTIVVVDIGLGTAANDDSVPVLVRAAEALGPVPQIPADAHKATRRRVLVVGGSAGMAGATVLAARAAMRSGVGLVKLCVEQPSVVPVQAAEATALTAAWPVDESALAEYLAWPHAVLLGPGLGLGGTSRELAERVLAAWSGPIVVDADALSAFAGRAERLGALLGGRPAVITPHAGEAERLTGVSAADLDAGRFEAAAMLARRVQATVLLKGVPTVVSDGAVTRVVAAGTPALATGGSGDVLGGIVATLLAQTRDALAAAASGAWVHGRAAEIAGGGAVRGVALDDVVAALRHAWTPPPTAAWPVLAELPPVGGAS